MAKREDTDPEGWSKVQVLGWLSYVFGVLGAVARHGLALVRDLQQLDMSAESAPEG